jgi:RNA polymerase primary sigma factor
MDSKRCGKNDSIGDYLKSISNNLPRLKTDEELELVVKAQNGDLDSRNKIILNNFHIITWIAKRYVGLGLTLEDLINEGVIGMLKSIDSFNVSTGTKFVAFSSSYVKQQIRLALSNNSSTIRLPNHMVTVLRKWSKAKAKIEMNSNRIADFDEIADHLGLSNKMRMHVKSAQRSRNLANIESSQMSRDFSRNSNDQFHNQPTCHLEIHEAELQLANLLDRLSEIERKVIILRFGLSGRKPLSWKAIGNLLGITREWASKLERRAINKMKTEPTRRYKDDLGFNGSSSPALSERLPREQLSNVEFWRNRE